MRSVRGIRRFAAQAGKHISDGAPGVATAHGAVPHSGGSYSLGTLAAVGAAGVVGGIIVEKKDAQIKGLARTTGFRACCDTTLTDQQMKLPDKLDGIVGKANVSRNVTQVGSRLGKGIAMVVVKPGSMAEAVDVLKACVEADVAIIPQGANTSLTGASVPRNDCDRPFVCINMRRLNKIMPIGDDAKQVLCFAGAGIFDLSDKLKAEFNRDSHSVLGSIFLNPSVAAGVSFGSGGTQIRKGPAFTDRALYARVLKNGQIEIVNTLGLKDGGDPFAFLQKKDKLAKDDLDPQCKSPCSYPDYSERLLKFDEEVSRYNADTYGEDCNRCEGKVMILATMHDTWPIPEKEKKVWVSCKDFETANAIKKEVCLTSTKVMARSCEYFNREIYEVTDKGGRLCVECINLLGMRPIGYLWEVKRFIEGLPIPFASIIPEKFMWWFNPLFPKSLPKAFQELGDNFDHHLLIELSEYSPGEVDALQALLDKFVASKPAGDVKYLECASASDSARVTLFRFVMAIAFRVYCTGMGMQGLSVDYSAPKSRTTYPVLPAEFPIAKRCCYSHFGCNVYHEDYVFGPEIDVESAKHAIKHAIEHQGGKLPAEHGHGTEYHAPLDTQQRWMAMDPRNTMNPGVGGTSSNKDYSSVPGHLACSSKACAHLAAH